jgi:hypothetical protein
MFSNTDTYHRLLRGLELDVDYAELVYDIHFLKFNIDAWFNKTLSRSLGATRPASDWLPTAALDDDDVRRLLPDPALSESTTGLQQLRDFVQACAGAGRRVEITSQNLDEETYRCVVCAPRANDGGATRSARRVRIFNVVPRTHPSGGGGCTRVRVTRGCASDTTSTADTGDPVEFDLGYTVSKHVLLQFVLNPFWEYVSADPADNCTAALPGAPDVLVVDKKSGAVSIRCAEGLPFRLDCAPPYVKELFIMRVLNPFFDTSFVDFDRMQASILAVMRDDRVRSAPKTLLWAAYREACALLIANRSRYAINPRGLAAEYAKKSVKWCLGGPLPVAEDELETDGSIYDLDPAALADIETLRSWKVACNDIYLLIPFIQRSRDAVHMIPHFLVDAPSLPFCKVRHQIIRSFMENKHTGSRYVSSYGYNYLRRRKSVPQISCRGGFVLTPELVRVSEALELLTDGQTSLFDLMARHGGDAFSAPRLGSLAGCSASDVAKARALLFALPRQRAWNADLAAFFDNHPRLLFDPRLDVCDIAVSLTSMDIAIDGAGGGAAGLQCSGYAEVDSRGVLSQFLSRHRILQDSVAPQEWGVPVICVGLHEFIDKFIAEGTYLLGASCLLIDNVRWTCADGVYPLLVSGGAVLAYDFDMQVRAFGPGTSDGHAYVFAGGKTFYKRLEGCGDGPGTSSDRPCARMNSVVVSVKGINREYLQWLLAVKTGGETTPGETTSGEP